MWYENNTIIEVFKAIIIDDVDKLEQQLKSDPKNNELKKDETTSSYVQ